MTNTKRALAIESIQGNLKQRSLRSGFVTIAAQPIKLIVGIGATTVLARLLTPADFGLLAMVAPVFAFADSLSNFGLETATVQKQALNHQQANVTFWFSLKVNAIVVTLIIAMGPVLASFYDQMALAVILPAMTLGFLSVCLSFQHKALLKRQMRFELLTTIDLVALLVATAIAIAAAWLGWRYWALVLQIVVVQVIQSAAYWVTCDWRPSWKAVSSSSDYRSTQEMIAYGAHLTGFRFISRIGMQLDRVLVGYFSGATMLGFYEVAYRWAAFPFMQVYFSLFDVATASFSRAYEDKEAYRRYCQWGIMPVFALCMPSLAFLWVAAEDVLLLLLGDQWLPAVPIFRLLTIAMFVNCLHRVTKWLYISSGQTRRQLRWGLIYTPLMIAAIVIGARWGTYGIAVGYTVGVCLLTYPSVAFCLARSPLTLKDFFSTVWRPAIASILSAAALLLSQPILFNVNNRIAHLTLAAVLFSAAYCCLWVLLPGGRKSIVQILTGLKLISSKGEK